MNDYQRLEARGWVWVRRGWAGDWYTKRRWMVFVPRLSYEPMRFYYVTKEA